MRPIAYLYVILASVGLTGCGTSARYVSKQSEGGVVAIPANSDDWPYHYRRNAEELIRRHVGDGYEIVEEHEFVTGQTTSKNQQVQREQTFNKDVPFLPAEKDTINTTTTHRDITEWHIVYRRIGSNLSAPILTAAPAGGSSAAGGVAPAAVVPSVNVSPLPR